MIICLSSERGSELCQIHQVLAVSSIIFILTIKVTDLIILNVIIIITVIITITVITTMIRGTDTAVYTSSFCGTGVENSNFGTEPINNNRCPKWE